MSETHAQSMRVEVSVMDPTSMVLGHGPRGGGGMC